MTLDWLWNLFHPWKRTPADVWLCPNIGSDYQRLFRTPELWPTVRAKITAYQMYGMALTVESETDPHYAGSRVGPNLFPAVVESGLFDRLREWKIPLCLELGSISRHDCSGQSSVEQFLAYRQRLTAVDSTLALVTLAEPLVEASFCEMSDAEAYTILQAHIIGAKSYGVGIGLTEAYGFISANRITTLLHRLAGGGAKPDWLHVGVDLYGDFHDLGGDLRQMQRVCQELGITFGVIATLGRARDEYEYRDAVKRVVRRVRGHLGCNPDRWICQSWWVRGMAEDADPTAPKDLPYTAPEDDPISLTGIAKWLMETS